VREIREANPRAHAKRAPAPYKGFAFARRQSRRPLACVLEYIFHPMMLLIPLIGIVKTTTECYLIP